MMGYWRIFRNRGVLGSGIVECLWMSNGLRDGSDGIRDGSDERRGRSSDLIEGSNKLRDLKEELWENSMVDPSSSVIGLVLKLDWLHGILPPRACDCFHSFILMNRGVGSSLCSGGVTTMGFLGDYPQTENGKSAFVLQEGLHQEEVL
ncbi:hypothetical protein L6452_02329 [Arctium lappa]|uniref:Uncharacterized protein n=1 Tax=Arctium lappa TaxID=4217 RepID=A0ACB9FJX7_ARCLA|nr:hypothetical protein L6452_02329 [Arctium lappa]